MSISNEMDVQTNVVRPDNGREEARHRRTPLRGRTSPPHAQRRHRAPRACDPVVRNVRLCR